MSEKKKDGKKEDAGAKGRINFDDISDKIKNLDDRNHLSQIGTAVSHTYTSHAKYTDANGVEMFKEKWNEAEAETLADKIYDQFVYHSHHRYFDLKPEHVASLKGFKGKNGESYVDTIVQLLFKLDRSDLKKRFKELAKNDDKINEKVLETILKENIQHHANYIVGKALKDVGPEHLGQLKDYIKDLGARHNLDEKTLKRAENTYDIQSLLQQYMQIVEQHYAKPKKKKE